MASGGGAYSNLLLLLFPGDVAPLQLPVAQEVPQVAEDGQDAVAHVGEHSHQHGCLLEGLREGSAVEGAMVRRCMDLGGQNKKNKKKSAVDIEPKYVSVLTYFSKQVIFFSLYFF